MCTINGAIKKLEKKGYLVVAPNDIRKCNCEYYRNEIGRITSKLNARIRKEATQLTIKDLKSKLATRGITELPKKKAELIDLYVTVFME